MEQDRIDALERGLAAFTERLEDIEAARVRRRVREAAPREGELAEAFFAGFELAQRIARQAALDAQVGIG